MTMTDAIYHGGKKKIKQNAKQGRRTLLLFLYAGHGATKNSQTSALLNSNDLEDLWELEKLLDEYCAQ